MNIRKGEISDIENIMQMYKSCVEGMIENGIDQWDKKYPNKEIILSDLKSQTYFILEENNIILGGINIDKKQDNTYLTMPWKDTNGSFLVVHRLAVKKDLWKQKIGLKLMRFVEELAKRKQLTSIRLDTYSNNPIAINFYKKLNYNFIGEIYLKPNKNEYYCFEKIIKKNK